FDLLRLLLLIGRTLGRGLRLFRCGVLLDGAAAHAAHNSAHTATGRPRSLLVGRRLLLRGRGRRFLSLSLRRLGRLVLLCVLRLGVLSFRLLAGRALGRLPRGSLLGSLLRTLLGTLARGLLGLSLLLLFLLLSRLWRDVLLQGFLLGRRLLGRGLRRRGLLGALLGCSLLSRGLLPALLGSGLPGSRLLGPGLLGPGLVGSGSSGVRLVLRHWLLSLGEPSPASQTRDHVGGLLVGQRRGRHLAGDPELPQHGDDLLAGDPQLLGHRVHAHPATEAFSINFSGRLNQRLFRRNGNLSPCKIFSRWVHVSCSKSPETAADQWKPQPPTRTGAGAATATS